MEDDRLRRGNGRVGEAPRGEGGEWWEESGGDMDDCEGDDWVRWWGDGEILFRDGVVRRRGVGRRTTWTG